MRHPGRFSSEVRLQLVAQEAGPPSKSLPLTAQAIQFDSLRYPGAAQFNNAIGAVVTDHFQPFQELAMQLASKGLMTPQEAATAAPAFRVELMDERADKSEPLPQPRSIDPRITFQAPTPGFSNPY